MEKTGGSKPVGRFGDEPLSAGKGRHFDGFAPEGALLAVLIRSPVARAGIRAIAAEVAAAAEGVDLVPTGADLEATLPENASPGIFSETEPGLDADRRIVVCRVKSFSNSGAFKSVEQGIGRPLSERVVHDRSGQFPSSTFIEYSMPLADNRAMFGLTTAPVTSTVNQLELDGLRRGRNCWRVGSSRRCSPRSRHLGRPDIFRAAPRYGRC